MKTIEDQLRQTARKSGLSMKAMSDRTGIPYAGLYNFVTHDGKTITLRTASKLAVLFNLELRSVGRSKKKG